jgi:hypothetical protein
MIDVKYINNEHKKEIEKYISSLKEIMYYATDEYYKGKYREYEKLLNGVVLYSNNFYETMKVERQKSIEEFIFIMPNMFFYMSIGFLGGIKNKNNAMIIQESEIRLSDITEDLVGVIADILMDNENESKIVNTAVQEIIAKN